jgi:hypothetical protein
MKLRNDKQRKVRDTHTDTYTHILPTPTLTYTHTHTNAHKHSQTHTRTHTARTLPDTDCTHDQLDSSTSPTLLLMALLLKNEV